MSFFSPRHCLPALFLFLSLSGAGTGFSRDPLDVVKGGRPLFNPQTFFSARTHSWGIFETRSGDPSKILHTQTVGHWEGGVLKFEQDLEIEGSRKTHRSWSIRRVDAHHYSAVGTGIVGTARGEAHGNAFHLDFTIDAIPGNPLAHLHMSQWMYLQPDGVTMVNRDTLTKAGVIVAEITEQFHKDR